MANAVSRLLFDPVDADRDRVPVRHRFSDDHRWWTVLMGAGLILLVIGAVVALGGGLGYALFAYLIGWVFCVSIAIGALFFVMIQHITKARWSTTIRRIPEAIAVSFPILAIAGIPVLLGNYDLYHWTHSELYDVNSPAYDYLIAGKRLYLNLPFFIVRYVLYFVIFSVLGHKLYTLSVRNDAHPDPENTRKMRFWSGLGIPLAAVATAFASYDFVMSTDPHWFSTMFGVYFFAGGWLGALCLITFLALAFKKAGMLPEVTREHLQDMGKFMFAFTVFWTYIAFSQYMLYWYANIPEETVWFLKRLTAGWGIVAAALLIFHFILPFLILLPRASKRIYPVLATMAVWLLVMHWVDLWWTTMPAREAPYGLDEYEVVVDASVGGADDGAVELVMLQEAGPADGVPATPGGATPEEVLDIDVLPPVFPIAEMMVGLGLFGLFLGSVLLRYRRHALTPYGDPYFNDSLRFENV
jgi:hypothetical protein